MDENRLEGNVRNVGGKVQEGVGRFTGDTKSKVEGAMNQAAGTAQDLYGQAADVVRQNAAPLEAWLRDQIETATLYDSDYRARDWLATRQDASPTVAVALL